MDQSRIAEFKLSIEQGLKVKVESGQLETITVQWVIHMISEEDPIRLRGKCIGNGDNRPDSMTGNSQHDMAEGASKWFRDSWQNLRQFYHKDLGPHARIWRKTEEEISKLQIKWNGEYKNLTEWAKTLSKTTNPGVTRTLLDTRIRRKTEEGMTRKKAIEEAFTEPIRKKTRSSGLLTLIPCDWKSYKELEAEFYKLIPEEEAIFHSQCVDERNAKRYKKGKVNYRTNIERIVHGSKNRFQVALSLLYKEGKVDKSKDGTMIKNLHEV